MEWEKYRKKTTEQDIDQNLPISCRHEMLVCKDAALYVYKMEQFRKGGKIQFVRSENHVQMVHNLCWSWIVDIHNFLQ